MLAIVAARLISPPPLRSTAAAPFAADDAKDYFVTGAAFHYFSAYLLPRRARSETLRQLHTPLPHFSGDSQRPALLAIHAAIFADR